MKYKFKKIAVPLISLALTALLAAPAGATSTTDAFRVIDTTAPVAISSLTPSTTTPGSVTITILAIDDRSGVASITEPDGTVVTDNTVKYTVTQNGTYDFILTDNAGNTSAEPVQVSNIVPDTTAPTGVYGLTPYATTNGTVTIYVLADDGQSGLASITEPDGTVVADNIAKYAVTKNGTYDFILTDNAGNKTTLSVPVSNITSFRMLDSTPARSAN